RVAVDDAVDPVRVARGRLAPWRTGRALGLGRTLTGSTGRQRAQGQDDERRRDPHRLDERAAHGTFIAAHADSARTARRTKAERLLLRRARRDVRPEGFG